MKVKIDKDKCIGCGACVAVCDHCFEISSDGKAEFKGCKDEKCCDDGCIKKAADACPVNAIIIEK